MSHLRGVLFSREMGLLGLVVVVLFGGLSTGHILSTYNLQTIALNNTVLALLALGVAPVIIAGDIDISIAAILSLCGVVMGQLWMGGLNIWLSAAAAVFLGAFLGVINGVLVVLLDLPSLAVTLGTLGTYTGVGFLILQGRAITNFPPALLFVGSGIIKGTPVPVSTVIVLVVIAVLTFIIHATSFGKALFAVGGGRQAALFSGVPVVRTRLTAFVISGVLSALAAVFYLGNYDTAQATIGASELLPAITAVILGGISAYGGTGTIPGVAAAVILLVLLEDALGLAGVSGQGQTIAVGILLVIAVGGGKLIRIFKQIFGVRSRSVGKGLPFADTDGSGSEQLAEENILTTSQGTQILAVKEDNT